MIKAELLSLLGVCYIEKIESGLIHSAIRFCIMCLRPSAGFQDCFVANISGQKLVLTRHSNP